MDRRSFLKVTTTGIVHTAAYRTVLDVPDLSSSIADSYPATVAFDKITRTWLGAAYWANRLQDWRINEGRIECLANGPEDQLRTVALLTYEIIRGPMSSLQRACRIA